MEVLGDALEVLPIPELWDAGHYAYLLAEVSGGRTYIGYTTDPHRRLRQHNRIIHGGAKATNGRRWELKAVVGGFGCMPHAMMLEWKWKRHSRMKRGADGKLESLAQVLALPQFTSRAPLTSSFDLKVFYTNA